MRKLERICVFCGSKEGNDQLIIDVASELGYALADHDLLKHILIQMQRQ